MANFTTPANDTYLAHNGWKNGSLNGPQFATMWSPAGNASQPVNLTILPDNLATLLFSVTDNQHFAQTFAVARTLLSPDYYSQQIHCFYPLSGSYDFLTRVLFYLLLVFALLYRRHSWLAVAALGTAMTYSATTAVHAFALLTQFGWSIGPTNMESAQNFGDIDIMGVFIILNTSLMTITPILNWSTNVRRDKAQVIVALWGMLTFVAWVPITVYVSLRPDGTMLHLWKLDGMTALVSCPRSAMDKSSLCGPGMNITKELYTTCECFDFCSLLGPTAPMRKGATLVPFIMTQAVVARSEDPTYSFVDYYAQLMSTVIVLYGAFGLLHNQFSLREMRNLLLRFCDMHPRELKSLWTMARGKERNPRSISCINESTRTGLRKMQRCFAKTVALLFFLLGLFLTSICPFIFLSIVVLGELDMEQYPESEGNDAVGAWSPWVGAAFVLLVAVILRFQDTWEYLFISCGNWALRFVGVHSFDGKAEEKKVGVATVDSTSSIKKVFWRPIMHFGKSIRRAVDSAIFVFYEFRDWIQAPVPHCQMCGCEGCVSYRPLARAARASPDHVNSCVCQDCKLFHERVREVYNNHARPGNSCGCRVCSYIRERKTAGSWKGSDSPEETEVYKTLSMRILLKFDNGISDMLEDAAKQSVDDHSQTAPSPGRTSPTPAERRDSSTSIELQEPLLTQTTSRPSLIATPSVESTIELTSIPPKLPQAITSSPV